MNKNETKMISVYNRSTHPYTHFEKGAIINLEPGETKDVSESLAKMWVGDGKGDIIYSSEKPHIKQVNEINELKLKIAELEKELEAKNEEIKELKILSPLNSMVAEDAPLVSSKKKKK